MLKRKGSFAIIEKLVLIVVGGTMSEKIEVLGIKIDNCTAKEAMQSAVEYMDMEAIHIIELATVDGLIQSGELDELRPEIDNFHLILAGDKAILEAAGIGDHKRLQETEKKVFLKLFFQYLHKNHKRIYLLGETEEECTSYYKYFTQHHKGTQIVGMAKVVADDRADDMLVNAINGGEVDCIIAALSTPLQEDFIIKNKRLLNARLWLGIGKNQLPYEPEVSGFEKIGRFVIHRIFKKEIEKRKKIEDGCTEEK